MVNKVCPQLGQRQRKIDCEVGADDSSDDSSLESGLAGRESSKVIGRSVQGQHQPEGAAIALFAADIGFAIVGFGNRFYNR